MTKSGIDARRRIIIAAVKDEIDVLAVDGNPMKVMFLDPRENGGLQLTDLGFELMKDKFPHWSEAVPTRMTFANHTYLVSVSIFPYYVHDGLLTTFDPNLGVLIKMVSGDFEKLERLLPRT
jgi:hypothetical protein